MVVPGVSCSTQSSQPACKVNVAIVHNFTKIVLPGKWWYLYFIDVETGPQKCEIASMYVNLEFILRPVCFEKPN